MLPRKIGSYPSRRFTFDPEVLAVTIAVALVFGLFLAIVGAGPLTTGSGLVGPDGCATQVWRNPVSGQIEAVRTPQLGRDGQPQCR